MRKPYNVEYLYKGMIRRPEERKMVLAAIAFFGGQFLFAAWLFFR